MDLTICYLWECPDCDKTLLITEDVMIGDDIYCPSCSDRHSVNSIYHPKEFNGDIVSEPIRFL
jgi:DNA-directed RNA polymerase subunit RPC12/RpoP